MIYLDSAATSLHKPRAVSQAVQRAMSTMASPGRGGHAAAMAAAETVYECRAAAAELFHVADPEHVVFTMNATHALNLAIYSVVQPGDTVVISGYEHNSVTRPLHQMGAKVRVAAGRLFDPEAVLADFRRLLPGAKAAVCTHVSNVFGFVLPIAEIAELCARAGVPLIVDASQSAGVLQVDAQALHAAFVAMPGHKSLMGPQGTGLLLCRNNGRPLISGGTGSQSVLQSMPEDLPDRLEAGTHNVPGIAGLYEGIRYVSANRQIIQSHEIRLLRQMAAGLRTVQDLELFYDEKERSQAGVLSLRSRALDCEELAQRLADRGVAVRAGLHCSPLGHRSGGTFDTGTVRFSFSPFNTEQEVEKTVRIMREILLPRGRF